MEGLLERCVGSLRHDPRYRNDDRFIKVVIEHADKVEAPADLFNTLHKDKVGAKVDNCDHLCSSRCLLFCAQNRSSTRPW